MPELLLTDELSPIGRFSESLKPAKHDRRAFLRTATVASVGVGIALSNYKNVLALTQYSEADLWLNCVSNFIKRVASNDRASYLVDVLSKSGIGPAPYARDFHYSYASNYVFTRRISPEEVICSNGFEVNQFPFYDVQCPCGGITDLNAFEIRQITFDEEVTRFGCVLAPHSSRTEFEYNHHASNYRQTAAEYGARVEDYKVEYVRVFRGHNKSRYGYHISHKTQVGQNGKPLRTLLLSSEDF